MKQIPLGGVKGLGKFVLVDDCWYDVLIRYKWHIHSAGYAETFINGEHILMHQIVAMCMLKGKVVDHKDGNKLNNVEDNLRIVTQSENMMNQNKLSRKTSIYKGVCRSNAKWGIKRWVCQVKRNSKRVHHSLHMTETEAAKKYNEVVQDVFGEFSNLNKF
jgi:hypothetical protein